jgi:hypothetical protein
MIGDPLSGSIRREDYRLAGAADNGGDQGCRRPARAAVERGGAAIAATMRSASRPSARLIAATWLSTSPPAPETVTRS